MTKCSSIHPPFILFKSFIPQGDVLPILDEIIKTTMAEDGVEAGDIDTDAVVGQMMRSEAVQNLVSRLERRTVTVLPDPRPLHLPSLPHHIKSTFTGSLYISNSISPR